MLNLSTFLKFSYMFTNNGLLFLFEVFDESGFFLLYATMLGIKGMYM